MMKFPIRIPEGWRVILTQLFKSTELSDWYKAQGLNYPEHLAIDVVVGTPTYQQWATYGATIVCPFPLAEMIASDPGTDPGDMKSGRFQLRYTEPDGTQVIMGGIHCSDVVQGQWFKEGDTVAFIGNGGYVNPVPTVEDAYAGGHLHLTYIRKGPQDINGVPRDPLEIFDPNNPFRGSDSGFENDIRPIAWAMKWSKEKVDSILQMFRSAL